MARLLMLALVVLTVCALLPASVPAQAGERCFGDYCVSGRLLEYWEQNDGERAFGFPISPLQDEISGQKPVKVQWFQRHRLELHSDTPRPYDVQLGLLGAARLAQLGRPAAQPRSEPQPGCRYFDQTGHNVCGRWWEAWRANGVALDGQPDWTEAENLALFGLPLGEAQSETVDGVVREVQWFERARFERHPNEAAPFDIQFGLLGSEVRAAAARPSAPASPTATPAPAPSPVPTPTPTPAPAATSVYDGAWYGSLSRGTDLSFTVTNGQITYLEIDIKPHSDCRIVTKVDYSAPDRTPPAIDSAGRLAITLDEPTIAITLTGQFGPADRVQGEGRFKSTEGGCSSGDRFDWGATKAPKEELVEQIDGEWTGLTAKGEAVSLTVANRVITRFEVAFQKKDECTVVVTTPQPLTVNSFVLNFTSPVGPGYINGRFTSSREVEGFLQLEPVGKDCGSRVGEWRWGARRQG